MKIHKPFLHILYDAKAGTVSDMLSELQLISLDARDITIGNEVTRALEEIVYTIDFLEKNKLVNSSMEVGEAPHVHMVEVSTHSASQTEYLNSLLAKNYKKHLVITPEFTLFAERGYQMPSVRSREYKMVFLFVKTIIFAVITAVLNRLLL